MVVLSFLSPRELKRESKDNSEILFQSLELLVRLCLSSLKSILGIIEGALE